MTFDLARKRALKRFRRQLSVIDKQYRQPDEWEESWLIAAARAICAESYTLAMKCLEKCDLPASARSVDPVHRVSSRITLNDWQWVALHLE